MGKSSVVVGSLVLSDFFVTDSQLLPDLQLSVNNRLTVRVVVRALSRVSPEDFVLFDSRALATLPQLARFALMRQGRILA